MELDFSMVPTLIEKMKDKINDLQLALLLEETKSANLQKQLDEKQAEVNTLTETGEKMRFELDRMMEDYRASLEPVLPPLPDVMYYQPTQSTEDPILIPSVFVEDHGQKES